MPPVPLAAANDLLQEAHEVCAILATLLGTPSTDPLHVSARLQGPVEKGCAAIGLLRCARDALGEALPNFPANSLPTLHTWAQSPQVSGPTDTADTTVQCINTLVVFANHILTLTPPNTLHTHMLRTGRAAVVNAIQMLSALEADVLVSARAHTQSSRSVAESSGALPGTAPPVAPRVPARTAGRSDADVEDAAPLPDHTALMQRPERLPRVTPSQPRAPSPPNPLPSSHPTASHLSPRSGDLLDWAHVAERALHAMLLACSQELSPGEAVRLPPPPA